MLEPSHNNELPAIPGKRYFTIGEVSELCAVKPHVLRYWEQEFPFLKPKTKGPSKVRQYSEKDIEQIKLIHNLVKVMGFKLAAAKKIISSNRDGADKTAEVLQRLTAVRDELMAMKKELEGME